MSSQSGQTIIEVLVAATIVAVLLVGLLSLGTTSIKNSSYSKDLGLATKYSTQVSDWIKSEKSSVGWGALLAEIQETGPNNTYCLPTIPTLSALSDSAGFCTLPAQRIDDKFFRELNILVVDANRITLTITTSWEGTATHQSIIESEVTKW